MKVKYALKVFKIFSMIMFASANLSAESQKSDSLVIRAWEAWKTNDRAEVEKNFLDAVADDENNVRAYIGLTYLYSLLEEHDKSREIFMDVIRTADNPYPYICSAWLTSPFIIDFTKDDKKIIELLKKLSEDEDAPSMVRADANERLGEYYRGKRDFSKSRKLFDRVGAIKDWMVIGPFDNISAIGYSKVYPPEIEFVPDRVYEGKNSIPAEWFGICASMNNCWVNFLYHFVPSSSVFYANTFVYSPHKQVVHLRIGTSGSLKAFMNDDQVLGVFDENNNGLDTYISEVELQKGWNRLLIKCGYSEIERCNFLARITDVEGGLIDDLEYSTDKKEYPVQPGTRVKVIENFAEKFFERKIEENPTHLENYLLLADVYLRNDKAVEAELVLKDALERSSNCALFHWKLLDAYSRGEKYDELGTTVEKIFALDDDIPDILEYKIDKYLETEELDKAEELIEKLDQLYPESEISFANYMRLYSTREQFEKFVETTHAAYKKYPHYWFFMYTEALVSIRTTKNYDEAIKIYNNYLKNRYLSSVLSDLSNIYLEASKIDDWRKTSEKMIELNPYASGYYYSFGETYSTLQDHSNAEKMMKKAIQTAPNSSLYREKLGDIYRAQDKLEDAKQAYREALRYLPTNYDARESLRELEGKKSAFYQFDDYDLDKLIREAPDSDAYPKDDAVILLNDKKRVVYEKGASELMGEMLIKVFNKNGIDYFNEYWIYYGYYTESLTIEKAVVIKGDGSEIEADIDDNHIVFKSMQENDLIYMKWKRRNYYSGKLSMHFWDSFYLNSFFPYMNVRYALLVPEDREFQYKLQNISIEPERIRKEDGLIYQWTLTDEPAIEYEHGMPTLDDAGKVLYISSIPDWEYMVDWYADLSQTKTRSTYEVSDKAAELFEGKEHFSKEEKINTIYDFITENIRYSSVSFRQSALIPQKARNVLVNKIGDCKDMAALSIALLKEVGINAHYVLLNTNDSGLNEHVLPSIAFNHVITGVETENGMRYLDFTGYNYPPESVPVGDLDAFYLLIKPGIQSPEYLVKDQFMPRTVNRKCFVELQNDNNMKVNSVSTRTGSLAGAARDKFRHKSAEVRTKELSEALNSYYPNLKISKFELKAIDTLEPEVRYIYDYDIPGYVTSTSQFLFFKIPWEFVYQSMSALSYEERKYPLYYYSGVDTLLEDIKVKIPGGYEPIEQTRHEEFHCSVADYEIDYSYSDGVLEVRRKLVFKEWRIPADEYGEFKKFYNDFMKEDTRQILLKEI